ncbi:MAG: N-acetylneuraminate lyase [Clostridia bacterium]|nr:N-acetylneuraminate lyase [Clostridia bacterium]
MKHFDGIFTALLTPFDQNDKINEKALRELISMNIHMGVRGFYVSGSTAEAFLMTPEERREIFRIVRDAAPDQTLIAHIGSIHEKEAEDLGHYAAELGYDAISSVAPFYYKFSFEEIKSYYFRLAERVGLPMLVYNFPAFSGVDLGFDQFSEFLTSDLFLGVKHTSNDFFTLQRCKSAFPNKIIYNGFDEMFLSGLSMGADGGIGSTYNFMADKFVAIRKLFSEGKIAQAQAVQAEANRIIAVLVKVGVMQAEKEVLNQMGLEFGVCRRPFGEPTDEQKALIRKEITSKL